MQKVSPFLWFDTQAEEAATFYVSLFDNSAITGVTRQGGDGGDLEGNAMSVSFTLDGVVFHALNAGPVFSFNEAVSFLIATGDSVGGLATGGTIDGATADTTVVAGEASAGTMGGGSMGGGGGPR
jgi:uncharacterized glyoxalase superfamily protein PhnB